jgi:uncharacterized protein YndB with AHSA1/START domain
MSTETSTSLRVSRIIAAPPERVFEAWTTPEQIKEWSAPEGITVADAAVDLTVGGRYHIHMVSPEGPEYNARGVYREIDPPNRLSYTWRWDEEEHDVGETLVTVEFLDAGGSTEVIITHEQFPTAEAKDGHEQGWTSCLNRLEAKFA